jgi:hypothetical protein
MVIGLLWSRVGAAVPLVQTPGARGVFGRRDGGTHDAGLPPFLLRHVAVSTCPSVLFLHVLLVWVWFGVLPWVQQYPRGAGAGTVFGVAMLRPNKVVQAHA